MKSRTNRLARAAAMIALATAACGLFAAQRPAPSDAPLTDAERQAGWVMLFDGVSTRGWRGLGMDGFPSNRWVVQDSCLHCLGGPGRTNDIITQRKYQNFELSFEWMVPGPPGNTGVKYRVQDRKPGDGFAFGPEYQIMDDPQATDKHATGSLYDVFPPQGKHINPAGQFNAGRIVVRGDHVEHWLNGVKVVEFDFGSKRLADALARSKFKETDWAKQPLGHIALQDHHDEAWFRNLKIRELRAP